MEYNSGAYAGVRRRVMDTNDILVNLVQAIVGLAREISALNMEICALNCSVSALIPEEGNEDGRDR